MINKLFGIVFPGQGSQTVGMLSDIAAEFAEVEQTFTEASQVLGYDLWHLVQHGPSEDLDQTVHTQPALLAASYAIWKIIRSRTQILPALLAGHSLGEYTALLCANALSFHDALRLVAARGQYMQEAVSPGIGAMAAIVGLDEVTVVNICKQAVAADEILSPANYNSLGQIVVAGHLPAVERAVILAEEQGARLAKLIPVSVPSHCQLMQPAAERLATLLASLDLHQPTILVMSNVDVVTYQNVESIREGLVRQLSMPVRWIETIQSFAKAGITDVIECGPGKVLTGLNKRIVNSLRLSNTSDVENLRFVLEQAQESS